MDIQCTFCIQSPVLSESVPRSHWAGRSTQQYTVVPRLYSLESQARREKLRRKEWRWLLAPISTIWCDMHSLSCVTWLQQQHSEVQSCFFSTLLSTAGLPLFLLFSRKHLRCFPKVMVTAQSQFNSPMLWVQILLDFQSRSSALRPQHGYVGHNFLPCFSPQPSSLGFSVHAGSFVYVSFSLYFTLPPHHASLKTSPWVKNREALTPTI